MATATVRGPLPRRTVRLRLTLWYGGLFLLCGMGLLAATYLLLRHAVPGDAPHLEIPGSPDRLPEDARLIVTEAERALGRMRDDVLEQLLVQSGIALAVLVLLALALGWWLAGRILHRLRAITSTAREISATNLHRRLTLPGPDDELKELGDTFDDLLDRLEASFQAQQQFVANASHELRTPLARQRVIGQLAVADPDATLDSLRAAHERVLAAGAHQERLIEAMLTLTRSHAGFTVREDFNLGEVVREVVGARHRAEVTIRTSISDSPVTGHRALAERLVVNLVDNAIRHNVADGWVEVSCAGGVLAVANSGPIVPAGDVERLFQPFQRLGPARTGTGIGLGLSIVRAIATAHDATVEATPRADGGLVVTVTFPDCTY
ncbi:HAMP domain-containing histidine kinase [Allokutzneria sp. A3M-2-11 16]|uniref:sensor histidine kinase n=1 Tax=Allokutzneria sp. A3M-2-11 16 TaxID=2962043 RepID=UPI0020B76F09|nr:HAMP domain-containing sensor histidine kinase [Allokutzneria sp. A3M-2-11 16]MCP3803291.1 HAMP domain-containing histidine kinase [Allokutzneria sp. A3M-2-11 16]